MRLKLLVSFFCFYSITAGQVNIPRTDYQKYIIIQLVKIDVPVGKKPRFQTEINQKDIDKLGEPLRALAAYYSALSGSNCDRDDNCSLTSALGLGKQSSIKHIELLKKWFPDDSKVKKMIDQYCFVGISGANHFCDFRFLSFDQHNDTVNINYEIGCYDQGATTFFNGYDIALLNNTQIVFIKRTIPLNTGKIKRQH